MAKRQGAMEKWCQAELRGFPTDLRSSTAAQAALDLARRLDGGPADREATMLHRELRLTMDGLRARSGADLGSELERFLRGIGDPALRGSGF